MPSLGVVLLLLGLLERQGAQAIQIVGMNRLRAKPLREVLGRGVAAPKSPTLVAPVSRDGKPPVEGKWSLLETWKLELEQHKQQGSKGTHLTQFLESTSANYPPQMVKYAWWAKTYGGLVPVEITDLCGGASGLTKWEEVSPKCAVWTVTMLRCSMVCNNSNRFKGFGECMKKCGVKQPKCNMCEESSTGAPLKTEITRYCNHFCPKLNKCECAPEAKGDPNKGTKMQSSDEFFGCIGGCVYDCKPALDLELAFGFEIQWRDRKCPNLFFACGGVNSTQCRPIHNCPSVWDTDCIEKTCHPPLGTGMTPCYHDDPYCGGRTSFPDVMNDTDKGMLDMCSLPRGEEVPCGNYPLWKEADGFPQCAADLICDNVTHLCTPPPPPPPPPNVTNVTNVTNATNATNETAGPTLPPHPQWHELRAWAANGTHIPPDFHVMKPAKFLQKGASILQKIFGF